MLHRYVPYFLLYPMDFICFGGLITFAIGSSLTFRYFFKKTLSILPSLFDEKDQENANNVSIIATGIFIVTVSQYLSQQQKYLQ